MTLSCRRRHVLPATATARFGIAVDYFDYGFISDTAKRHLHCTVANVVIAFDRLRCGWLCRHRRLSRCGGWFSTSSSKIEPADQL
jgi:hypothetical protein